MSLDLNQDELTSPKFGRHVLSVVGLLAAGVFVVSSARDSFGEASIGTPHADVSASTNKVVAPAAFTNAPGL